VAKNPVYILPGTLCNDRMFAAQINALQNAGYTPCVIPFTEQSSILQMVELCKKIAQEPGPFIGFSMGGIVALALLKSNPELVVPRRGINTIKSYNRHVVGHFNAKVFF